MGFYRKDHDVLNLTKVRCSRHTYIPAVIHEHIFDKKIVWLSGCHQRIGLLPKGNTMNTCVRACIRAPAFACVLASVYGRECGQQKVNIAFSGILHYSKLIRLINVGAVDSEGRLSPQLLYRIRIRLNYYLLLQNN